MGGLQFNNACLANGKVSEWVLKGWITFIMKCSSEWANTENYKLIACLNLLWKLLTGNHVHNIYLYSDNNNLTFKIKETG